VPYKLIHVETRAGLPVDVGDTQIVPFARLIHLDIPGILGGLTWNRPSSILIKKGNGGEKVLNVPDVTRQAQIAVLGFGLLGGILLSLILSLVKRR